MDPYVYEGTDVLINKMNIRNAEELIEVEAQLFIANVLDIQSIVQQLNFQSHESLQIIHRHLFKEIYTWAGEYRTVNIYKSEQVLNGLSINYSDKNQIMYDLQKLFAWANRIQWNNDNPNLKKDFAKLMIDLWRIHPFREGNTRTVSIFMKLFAEKNHIYFKNEILANHPGYLRKALVLAAVEEAPEPVYLFRMLDDALNESSSHEISDKERAHQYKLIKQYDVSKYNEKPFETE